MVCCASQNLPVGEIQIDGRLHALVENRSDTPPPLSVGPHQVTNHDVPHGNVPTLGAHQAPASNARGTSRPCTVEVYTRVDAPVRPDVPRPILRVAHQLLVVPELEDVSWQRVLRPQGGEGFLVGAWGTAVGEARRVQPQLVVQHTRQLLW